LNFFLFCVSHLFIYFFSLQSGYYPLTMIAPPKVDHLRLLGSEGGIKMLLDGGKEQGIKIKANNWGNIVDFGVFSCDSLKSSVPLGYEEDQQEESERYLTQAISLSFDACNMGGVDTFTLTAFQSLPNKAEETFRLQLVTEEGNDATSITLRVGDDAIVLLVRLLIHSKYTRGNINEFLLLSFCGQTNHSPVSMSYAECTVGLRVQGTLMSPNEVVISQQLSAEAAPFIPKVALTYFDWRCPMFAVAVGDQGGSPDNVYTAPPGFKQATFALVQVTFQLLLCCAVLCCAVLCCFIFLFLLFCAVL
jgi:hypothetical protein